MRIVWGGVAGGLMGAVLSFAALFLYAATWTDSGPGNSLGPATGAGAAARFYCFVSLPAAAVLGAAAGAGLAAVRKRSRP